MVNALLADITGTYVLYINEKKQLNYLKANVVEQKDLTALSHFKIKERHLIVGLQFNGLSVYPYGDLKNYPLSPIERHLFNNGNINFEIPSHHFREADALFIMYNYTNVGNLISNADGYWEHLVAEIEETYVTAIGDGRNNSTPTP